MERISKIKIDSGLSIINYNGMPYSIFMRQVIFDMTERGQLHQIIIKWKIPEQNCVPLIRKGTPISIEKIATLFIGLLFGLLCAFIVFVVEKQSGSCFMSVFNTTYKHPKIKVNVLLNEFNELSKNYRGDSMLFSKIEEIHSSVTDFFETVD